MGSGPEGYSRFQVMGMIEGVFLGRKTWQAFFLGCLDLSRDFFGYSKQSEDSDSMMNKQTQTFNFYCSFFFRVISCKAFCKFLRLRNSAWDFFGLIFGPGIFWGFCWKP